MTKMMIMKTMKMMVMMKMMIDDEDDDDDEGNDNGSVDLGSDACQQHKYQVEPSSAYNI